MNFQDKIKELEKEIEETNSEELCLTKKAYLQLARNVWKEAQKLVSDEIDKMVGYFDNKVEGLVFVMKLKSSLGLVLN